MTWRHSIRRLLWILPYTLLVWAGLFALDEVTKRAQYYRLLQAAEGEAIAIDQATEQSSLSGKPAFFITIDPVGWCPSLYDTPSWRRYARLSHFAPDPSTTRQLVEAASAAKVSEGHIGRALRRWLAYGEQADWNVLRTNASALSDSLRAAIDACQRYDGVYQLLPRLHVHGFDNRFWAFGTQYFHTGQLRSRIDGRPVWDKLTQALSITLLYQVLTLVIVFTLGMWLGRLIYSRSKGWPVVVEQMLYVLYALPLFWIGSLVLYLVYKLLGGVTLLLEKVTSTDYVSMWDMLHPSNWDLLLWPVVTMVMGSLAVVSIQMARGLSSTDREQYILAARARGLSDTVRLRLHQLPHARYTMMTLLANSIPGLLTGSIVVELIFNVPGMGRLLWTSLHGYDWPVVYPLLTCMLMISLLSQLVADVFYHSRYTQGG